MKRDRFELSTSRGWPQNENECTHDLTLLDLAESGEIGQNLVLILALPLISWVTLCTLLTASSLSFLDCQMRIEQYQLTVL